MSDAKGGRFHVDKCPKGGRFHELRGGDFTWISATIHKNDRYSAARRRGGDFTKSDGWAAFIGNGRRRADQQHSSGDRLHLRLGINSQYLFESRQELLLEVLIGVFASILLGELLA